MTNNRLSIRKFLLFNLLVSFITTIFITVVGTYYFGHREISTGLDDLLQEVGFVFNRIIELQGNKKSEAHPLTTPPGYTQDYQQKPDLDFSGESEKSFGNRYLFQIWSQGKLLFSSENLPTSHSQATQLVFQIGIFMGIPGGYSP